MTGLPLGHVEILALRCGGSRGCPAIDSPKVEDGAGVPKSALVCRRPGYKPRTALLRGATTPFGSARQASTIVVGNSGGLLELRFSIAPLAYFNIWSQEPTLGWAQVVANYKRL